MINWAFPILGSGAKMAVDSERGTELIIVPATGRRADGALVDALQQFRQPPNTNSECQQPAMSVVVEVCIWVVVASLAWVILALSL